MTDREDLLLTGTSHHETATNEPEALVLIVFGLEVPVEYTLPTQGTLVLGRGVQADVQIAHSTISRAHASIEIRGERFTVRDLASTHGVYVRGQRIRVGEEAPFAVGEVIGAGVASLVVARPARALRVSRAPPAADGRAVVAHPAMVRLYELVARVAASEVNVLLQGETGAGKELVAEALHRGSARASKPLVRVNCAALSPSLIESELFGHEKGAFTGATDARPGYFELAHGGTLLLDEVGDLPLSLQAKLLRVLEDRHVFRVGSQRGRRVDVRIVAATHHDLRAEVESGAFRRDLYHRLDGIALVVPPLRERVEEVRPLAEHFLAAAGYRRLPLARAVVEALEAYPWPGNVRELRNVVARAALVANDRAIDVTDLPRELIGATTRAPARDGATDLRGEIESLERRRIEAALADAKGNQTRAAALLGMPRRTFVTRLGQYGIARPRKRRKK